MATAASILVAALGAYLAIGLVAGGAFVLRGVDRIDPAISISPRRVRLLLLPGAAALWPVMAAKWVRAPKRMNHAKAGHA